MLDLDDDGRVTGIGVLAVSEPPGANPMQMAFEVLAERPPKPAEAA